LVDEVWIGVRRGLWMSPRFYFELQSGVESSLAIEW